MNYKYTLWQMVLALKNTGYVRIKYFDWLGVWMEPLYGAFQ